MGLRRSHRCSMADGSSTKTGYTSIAQRFPGMAAHLGPSSRQGLPRGDDAAPDICEGRIGPAGHAAAGSAHHPRSGAAVALSIQPAGGTLVAALPVPAIAWRLSRIDHFCGGVKKNLARLLNVSGSDVLSTTSGSFTGPLQQVCVRAHRDDEASTRAPGKETRARGWDGARLTASPHHSE